MIVRPPRPDLAAAVQCVWLTEGQVDDSPASTQRDRHAEDPKFRERVLPTGQMHVAIRLGDSPLRIYSEATDRIGTEVGFAVIGGPRSGPYFRDVSEPSYTVGAMLHPGAGEMLLGIPAAELAERHTRLEDCLGSPAEHLRDELRSAATTERKLGLFESFLASRLLRVRGLHPAVALALERFIRSFDVGAVVRETGYSHRHFISLFTRSVGLTPKRYCRTIRFQQALHRLSGDHSVELAALALDVGYTDQAHLNREFRAFADVSPGTYQRLRPVRAHHIPIVDAPAHLPEPHRKVNSVQDEGMQAD